MYDDVQMQEKEMKKAEGQDRGRSGWGRVVIEGFKLKSFL